MNFDYLQKFSLQNLGIWDFLVALRESFPAKILIFTKVFSCKSFPLYGKLELILFQQKFSILILGVACYWKMLSCNFYAIHMCYSVVCVLLVYFVRTLGLVGFVRTLGL